MDFPQYRKLSNGHSFYKINSEREFEELQLIGNTVILHKIKAEKYPEIIRINDLLNDKKTYLQSTADEYDSISSGLR